MQGVALQENQQGISGHILIDNINNLDHNSVENLNDLNSFPMPLSAVPLVSSWRRWLLLWASRFARLQAEKKTSP